MNEKQKIEGVENKELYIFIGIIAIVFILLIFEMFFFKGRTTVVEEMAVAEEELQKKADTTVENEQRNVYNALTNIVNLMNNKEYEKLYDMLKDDYKEYYFREYKNFEEFMKVYAKYDFYPKYNSYYRDGDLYYVIVEFLHSKYTRDQLLNNRVSKIDTIVLEETENGEFKLALNGFIENVIHNKSEVVDGVTFILQNSVKKVETMETTVSVINNSDKEVTVSTTNIQPEILGLATVKLSATSSLNLLPGEFGFLTIEYYFQYDSEREFNGIKITGAQFDDGTIIEDVLISK